MRIEHLSAHKKLKMRHVCGTRLKLMPSVRHSNVVIYNLYCQHGDTFYIALAVGRRGYDSHNLITIKNISGYRASHRYHHYQGTRLR